MNAAVGVRGDYVDEILRQLAEAIRAAFARTVRGQAEEQLKRPVSEFLEQMGRHLSLTIEVTPELAVTDGRPDLGVLSGGLLNGHVELKAPGLEVNPDYMRGRNRRQWEKFRALPNLLYTNGRDWRLYRTGQLLTACSLSGDPSAEGAEAVSAEAAERVGRLLVSFLSWQPIAPTRARELAQFLAPLTRVLRDDVLAALRTRRGPLVSLRNEWRAYLFPEVSNEQFADAYAQTVVSALLLARLEGARTTSAAEAEQVLRAQNSLLGRILTILTQHAVRTDVALGLSLIERALSVIDVVILSRSASDPWLYFYEDFLHAYDPKLAKDAGVYYTPAQIVRLQVRLVSDLLTEQFGKPYSYAQAGITVLDPAVGTGTYLVAAVQKALEVVSARAGAQLGSRAPVLARNLVGFELLVGPYAVAHLRLARELSSIPGAPAEVGALLRVYLADTLESPYPHDSGVLVPLIHEPLVQERENARQVKAEENVIVCLGNPPYDRQMDVGADRKGGWVRYGDQTQGRPILEDFLEPARAAGQGVNIRSIYNDYVYFWRWALWKVFETQDPAASQGIVSFITGSSYLTGPGFVGMREHMRRCFDELWIIDLGGDNKGSRKEPNVFNIQTPVAIATGVRYGPARPAQPAVTRYIRVTGSVAAKLDTLEGIRRMDSVLWRDCPDGWQDPFRPPLTGAYANWPLLRDLFPWQHNGSQFVRTWPIGVTRDVLIDRWTALAGTDVEGRGEALKETRDRTIDWVSERVQLPNASGPALREINSGTPCPEPIRYAFRSFDRRWALYDGRIGDYLKPVLWVCHGPHQIYLTTSIAMPLGYGPAAIATNLPPDLHHFCGRGGKDLIPLYRDQEGLRANVTSGLLRVLGVRLRTEITAEHLFAYVYGILGARAYSTRFWDELETPGPRIPLAASADLFFRVSAFGRTLARLHSFGHLFRVGDAPAVVEPGLARVAVDIPIDPADYPQEYEYDLASAELRIGAGIISGVSEEVWNFEVSDLHVLQSWLGARMRSPTGRTSSPLDRIRPEIWTATMTEELLEVIWTLERCVGADATGRSLLEEVLAGEFVLADELPIPTPADRRPPRLSGDDPAELL
jgi:hypothetical protein